MTMRDDMKPVNKTPLLVDFNSRDKDGAVWLSGFGIVKQIAEMGLTLSEGDILWVTDGELEIKGPVTYRIDRWVVIPDEGGFTGGHAAGAIPGRG